MEYRWLTKPCKYCKEHYGVHNTLSLKFWVTCSGCNKYISIAKHGGFQHRETPAEYNKRIERIKTVESDYKGLMLQLGLAESELARLRTMIELRIEDEKE